MYRPERTSRPRFGEVGAAEGSQRGETQGEEKLEAQAHQGAGVASGLLRHQGVGHQEELNASLSKVNVQVPGGQPRGSTMPLDLLAIAGQNLHLPNSSPGLEGGGLRGCFPVSLETLNRHMPRKYANIRGSGRCHSSSCEFGCLEAN